MQQNGTYYKTSKNSHHHKYHLLSLSPSLFRHYPLEVNLKQKNQGKLIHLRAGKAQLEMPLWRLGKNPKLGFAMIIRLPKRCRRLKKMDLRWDRSLGTASSPVMEVGWLGHSFTSFLFFDRREGLLCTLPKHAIISRPNVCSGIQDNDNHSMNSTHERDSALFLSQTNGWWYFPQKCDRENPSSHTHWF